MKDQSDNGAAARVIEKIDIEPTARRLNQTLERLLDQHARGAVTTRSALTTMMLRAMRAGRDLEIAAQLDSAKRPHLVHSAAGVEVAAVAKRALGE